MSERHIMERFDEIMAGFDKHPYARLMERNTTLEMLVIKQRDLLDECERALTLIHLATQNSATRMSDVSRDIRKVLAKLRSQEKADE